MKKEQIIDLTEIVLEAYELYMIKEYSIEYSSTFDYDDDTIISSLTTGNDLTEN